MQQTAIGQSEQKKQLAIAAGLKFITSQQNAGLLSESQMKTCAQYFQSGKFNGYDTMLLSIVPGHRLSDCFDSTSFYVCSTCGKTYCSKCFNHKSHIYHNYCAAYDRRDHYTFKRKAHESKRCIQTYCPILICSSIKQAGPNYFKPKGPSEQQEKLFEKVVLHLLKQTYPYLKECWPILADGNSRIIQKAFNGYLPSFIKICKSEATEVIEEAVRKIAFNSDIDQDNLLQMTLFPIMLEKFCECIFLKKETDLPLPLTRVIEHLVDIPILNVLAARGILYKDGASIHYIAQIRYYIRILKRRPDSGNLDLVWLEMKKRNNFADLSKLRLLSSNQLFFLIQSTFDSSQILSTVFISALFDKILTIIKKQNKIDAGLVNNLLQYLQYKYSDNLPKLLKTELDMEASLPILAQSYVSTVLTHQQIDHLSLPTFTIFQNLLGESIKPIIQQHWTQQESLHYLNCKGVSNILKRLLFKFSMFEIKTLEILCKNIKNQQRQQQKLHDIHSQGLRWFQNQFRLMQKISRVTILRIRDSGIIDRHSLEKCLQSSAKWCEEDQHFYYKQDPSQQLLKEQNYKFFNFSMPVAGSDHWSTQKKQIMNSLLDGLFDNIMQRQSNFVVSYQSFSEQVKEQFIKFASLFEGLISNQSVALSVFLKNGGSFIQQSPSKEQNNQKAAIQDQSARKEQNIIREKTEQDQFRQLHTQKEQTLIQQSPSKLQQNISKEQQIGLEQLQKIEELPQSKQPASQQIEQISQQEPEVMKSSEQSPQSLMQKKRQAKKNSILGRYQMKSKFAEMMKEVSVVNEGPTCMICHGHSDVSSNEGILVYPAWMEENKFDSRASLLSKNNSKIVDTCMHAVHRQCIYISKPYNLKTDVFQCPLCKRTSAFALAVPDALQDCSYVIRQIELLNLKGILKKYNLSLLSIMESVASRITMTVIFEPSERSEKILKFMLDYLQAMLIDKQSAQEIKKRETEVQLSQKDAILGNLKACIMLMLRDLLLFREISQKSNKEISKYCDKIRESDDGSLLQPVLNVIQSSLQNGKQIVIDWGVPSERIFTAPAWERIIGEIQAPETIDKCLSMREECIVCRRDLKDIFCFKCKQIFCLYCHSSTHKSHGMFLNLSKGSIQTKLSQSNRQTLYRDSIFRDPFNEKISEELSKYVLDKNRLIKAIVEQTKRK